VAVEVLHIPGLRILVDLVGLKSLESYCIVASLNVFRIISSSELHDRARKSSGRSREIYVR